MGKLNLEELRKKAGGRFDLVVLTQKRLRDLARSGVKTTSTENSHSLMESVLEEIRTDKIKISRPKEKK
ncbi:MAG: DNA-directed RNA polymerase subunit omega [Planctomycetes bacterium]|nr:DNA-directed RNA polymerase subunit omega [Planctomycetota bacterium]